MSDISIINKKSVFICSTCLEKSDDIEEYIYPMSELVNPYDDEENWICKECFADEIHDKQMEKYREFDYE